MNEEAVRVALSAPEAWATLTVPQVAALEALIKHGSVRAAARALGVTRQAIYDRLHYAEKTLLAFVKAIEDAAA